MGTDKSRSTMTETSLIKILQVIQYLQPILCYQVNQTLTIEFSSACVEVIISVTFFVLARYLGLSAQQII